MPKNSNLWVEGQPSPYQYKDITHFPDWHNLIVWDAFFNNLTSGLMIVTVLAWISGMAAFGLLLPLALTLAFILVAVDLVLLVADLGDSMRFPHAMRVMRFTSPLSVGVWGLASYSIFLFLAVCLSWIAVFTQNGAGLGYYLISVLLRVCVTLSCIGAIVVICYKGVVFSCSSQPGLKNARWLTPFMVSDSLLIGMAAYMLLAIFYTPGPAATHLAIPMAILICARCLTFALLWTDVRKRARLVHSTENTLVGWSLYGIGGVAAIILLFFGSVGMFLAAVITLLCGVMERYWLIGLARPVPLHPVAEQ